MKKYIVLLIACLLSVCFSYAANYTIYLQEIRSFDTSESGLINIGGAGGTFRLPFIGVNSNFSDWELKEEIRISISQEYGLSWIYPQEVRFTSTGENHLSREGYVEFYIAGSFELRNITFQCSNSGPDNTFTVSQNNPPKIYDVWAPQTTYIPTQNMAVILNGSETRYSYELVRSDGGSLVVADTKAGTGGSLSFTTNRAGTYNVRIAGQGMMMNGSITLRHNYLFEQIYRFYDNEMTYDEEHVYLDKDGERKVFSFAGYGSVDEFEELFKEFNMGRVPGWNPSMHMEFIQFDDDEHEAHMMAVLCGPNISASHITNSTLLYCDIGYNHLVVSQPKGGSLKTFTVSGEVNPNDISKHTISLSGSQYVVNYKVYRDDGTFHGEKLGNGGVLNFENISAPGTYTIVAHYMGQTCNMSGSYEIGVAFSDLNYIKEETYVASNQKTSNMTYYDGLGRTTQTIQIGASPVGEQDIVSFVEYDCMGRADSVAYLPYAVSSRSGLLRTDPLAEQQNFYSRVYQHTNSYYDKNYAYARKEYDKSGMGITLKQGAAGQAYQLEAHPTKYEYGFNGCWGKLRKYGVDRNTATLQYLGYYADETLTFKAILQPTEGIEESIMIEYYEPNGNLVAREQHISETNRRITYYVYDDLGRQRYIIPPSVDITTTTSFSQSVYDCFYTEYDEYGRVFKQYVPGTSYTLSLYDKRGRLALTQTGEQRETGKWSYTKYDNYDRPVISGVLSGGTCESHKAALETQTIFGESQNSYSLHGYTNQCYPTAINDNDVLSVSYYDNYSLIGEDYEFRPGLSLGNTPNYRIRGLETAKKIKVLDQGAPQWLTTVIYYDEKYQTIQTIADLYPQGKEVVANKHDYTGNVIQSQVRQETPSATHEYYKWFSYDNHGRLLSIDQKITNDTENGRVTIAGYTYDELGRATTKRLHNGYDSGRYWYTLNGVNTAINYSQLSLSVLSTEASVAQDRFDGKPTQSEWWVYGPDEKAAGYQYVYDSTGQLAKAQYLVYSEDYDEFRPNSAFCEQDIIYDKNGNILRLKRTDEQGGILHDLAYTYNRNQLTKLTCNGQEYTGYTYDECGNLTYDPVEQLHYEYNELNLPSRIFGDNGEIHYIYDAEGHKLATLTNGSFTYYRSVMVYGGVTGSNEELQYMLHPEGTIQYNNGRFAYNYHLTDYADNVRCVLAADNVSSSLVVQQDMNYYPFGLAHNYNNLHRNRYLFTGKELQDQTIGNSGFLGLYDFGARYYNPMLGRWFNPDPALQTTNPYLFCGNAPMAYIDKDGRFAWFIPLIGAAVGALGYTASVTISPGGFDNWNWGDFGKAMGFGAVAGATSGVIGEAFGAIGSIGNELTRAVAHGMSSMTLSAAMNGQIGLGDFLIGMGSSLIGSATQNLSNGMQIGLSSVTGGIVSELSGGDFWQGAATGAIVSSLNHGLHGDYQRTRKHVAAAQEFLIAEGHDEDQVRKDITVQRNSIFTKNFAKFDKFYKYQSSFTGGHIDSYSKTKDAWLSKAVHKLKLGGSYALKYYPSRDHSVGVVRTGIGHWYEFGRTILSKKYDMHGRNSSDYLNKRGRFYYGFPAY